MLLFFTGYSRDADKVLTEQQTRSETGDEDMLDNLHMVKELGQASRQALEMRRPDRVRRAHGRALAAQAEAIGGYVQRQHRPVVPTRRAIVGRSAANLSALGRGASSSSTPRTRTGSGRQWPQKEFQRSGLASTMKAPHCSRGPDVQCLVLAGGMGTRMRPFTDSVPKMLLKVAGRPFADWQLSWLADQGVKRVILSVGHLGLALRRFVGDGSRWDLDLVVVDEGEELLGTGGAVRNAVDCGLMEDEFTLLYGDSYLSIDLSDVARAFSDAPEPALMTLYRNAGQFDQSNAIFAAGKVLRYEKGAPDNPGMDWIDYGLSVLRRDLVVDRIPAGVGDLARLFAELSREGQLAGYEVQERFYEVGSPAGLADLEALFNRLQAPGQGWGHDSGRPGGALHIH